MRSKSILGIVILGGTVLALAVPAFGALPTKGGVYSWKNPGNTQTLVAWIKLQVRPDGKSARVQWSCNNAPPPTSLTFKLSPDGTFKGVSNPSGHLLIWYIQGRFVSPTQAKVFLSLNIACAGKGIHTLLKLER